MLSACWLMKMMKTITPRSAVATDCRWPGRAELEADGGGVRDVKAVVAPAGKDLLDLHPGGLSHERLPVLEPVSDDPAVPQ
jgi:hypothetical protein